MYVSLLLRQSYRIPILAVLPNILQREHAASMATTTRTLEIFQQERPTGDVAGKETEIGGGGRDSSEQC